MEYEQTIAELESTLKERDARIKELIQDRDESWAAVSRTQEQIQEWVELLERWQEAFSVDDEFWVKYHAERDRHKDLLKKWNAVVQIYNARVAPSLRNFGRPVAASPTQKDDVLKRRKPGQSLRSIAGETGLGLQTVRTIIDKRDGLDRATAARLKRILPDKLAKPMRRQD